MKKKWIAGLAISALIVCMTLGLAACGGGFDASKYDLSGITFSDLTVVYDGQAHAVEIDGELPEGVTVAYSENTRTDAGTQIATAEFKVGENLLDTKTATLTVQKARYDMSAVTFEDVTVDYDGTEHRIEVEGTLPEGVTVAYEENARTNAGVSEAIAHFTGNPNYEAIADKTAILTVNRIALDVTDLRFESGTFAYDGTAHRLEPTGVPEGVIVSYSGKNDQTEPGTYSVTARFDTGVNYLPIPEMTATMTVTKANFDASKFKFKDKNYVYSGDARAIVVEHPYGDVVRIEYNQQPKTEAGEYEFVATLTNLEPEHYTDLPVSVQTMRATLTIERRVIEMGTYQELRTGLETYASVSANCKFALTADIACPTDAAWAPIGNWDNNFRGEFDGQGHKIIGLNMTTDSAVTADTWSSANQYFIGMFGVANGEAYIHNFVLENPTATLETNQLLNFGFVVGRTGASGAHVRVTDITLTKPSINITALRAHAVGGFIGFDRTEEEVLVRANLKVSEANFNVTTTGSASASVGGIVGKNELAGQAPLFAYDRCRVSGTIKVVAKAVEKTDGTKTAAACGVGGIIGMWQKDKLSFVRGCVVNVKLDLVNEADGSRMNFGAYGGCDNAFAGDAIDLKDKIDGIDAPYSKEGSVIYVNGKQIAETPDSGKDSSSSEFVPDPVEPGPTDPEIPEVGI